MNLEVFTKIRTANAKILLVCKYWDANITKNLFKTVQTHFPSIIYGIWENRIEDIRYKGISRENMHFIWNIQSQKIPEIVKYCSHIHSLSSLKHAKKIENQWTQTNAFIQIKLDPEKNTWITQWELWNFLDACKGFKNLKFIWISGMWSSEVHENKKRQEFQTLISLRNIYLPDWHISAGTSRDYEIALQEWIDIVRIGKKIMETE